MNEGPMNENGLSWLRWYAAATLGATTTQVVESGTNPAQMRESWRSGECPCDWAAFFAGVTV